MFLLPLHTVLPPPGMITQLQRRAQLSLAFSLKLNYLTMESKNAALPDRLLGPDHVPGTCKYQRDCFLER